MFLRVPTAVCAALLGLAGCYRYAPLDLDAGAPAGADLRLYLTPEGSQRVAPTLGPQTTAVAGRTTAAANPAGPAAAPAALSLVVSATTKADGGTLRWMGERVAIPRAALARGERRVLDRPRTLLAGGGVALGAIAGYAILRAVSGGGGGDDGGTPPISP